MFLAMRHDLRAPAWGAATASEIYAAALEQWRWAEEHGWDTAALSEHHGIDDGWNPAPLTVAAAIAAMTNRISIVVSAAIVPLHDPVRLAEQIAVLDLLSEGRVWTVVGAGYRRDEFDMADVEYARRGRLLEEYVHVMLDAWTGEPFTWRGRTIRVTPHPRTQPHPLVFMGGGTEAAARRAARLHLPMLPMNTDAQLVEWYEDESEKVGFIGGYVLVPEGPTFVHVSEDPDQAWAEIGPYLLYEAQTYASFQTPGQHSTPMVAADTVEDLKASPQIVVGTPDEVAARIAALPPRASVTFNPLAGGLPPDLAWESLELFAAKVQPAVGR